MDELTEHERGLRFTLNQIDSCLRLDVWSADTGRA